MFGVSGGKVVYSQVTPANPNELFLAGRQLTSLNEGWLKDKELSQPEEHWITRPDGTKVQYWVMRPTRAQAGKKVSMGFRHARRPVRHVGPGRI